MISRIENASDGRYLYIQSGTNADGFESRMASSLISESIIAPTLVFAYGEMCMEYCITGLKGLEEYLSGAKLNSRDITGLLAQTEQSVNTVRNYLLSESDLLINTDYVYVDDHSGLLKLCIVPGYNGDFEQELKCFINKLLMHIDAEDIRTLKLGFKLFKAVSSKDFKLHDVISVLRDVSSKRSSVNEAYKNMPYEPNPPLRSDCSLQEAYEGSGDNAAGASGLLHSNAAGGNLHVPDFETEADCGSSSFTLGRDIQSDYPDAKASANPYSGAYTSDMRPGYDRQDAAGSGFDEADEAPDKLRSILKETLSGLIVSQGILVAVAIVVFLLKGRALVMRLIPIYLIIAACVTVYYAASFILKRRQEA